MMYGDAFEVTDAEMDMNYVLPIGKAEVIKEGTDITICAYAKMVKFSLMAAEELKKEGINVEVVNLRSIRPLDRETIVNSVKKTHRLVTVEEGWG
jgi:pyruvate dehydrogenase E1 component beta subunit